MCDGGGMIGVQCVTEGAGGDRSTVCVRGEG